MDNRRNDGWDMIIRPRKGWFDIDFKGLVRYRDLILLMGARDPSLEGFAKHVFERLKARP